MSASEELTASMVRKNQIIMLTGPTAVGKSSVARELSRLVDAEIVIADSVQIYKYLDIGSNKPSAEEQAETPHHLVDVVDPSDGQDCSSGDFVRLAVPAIADILSRNKVPIVVGGSTMWIDWLIRGPPDAPKADKESTTLAQHLVGPLEENDDWDTAMSILRERSVGKKDRTRADKLPRNDWYRLKRFLEVLLTKERLGESGVTGERQPALAGFDVRCFFIAEQRRDLYRVIDERCTQLLQMGLMEEVVSLVSNNHLLPGSVASKAIGYRQTIAYLSSVLQRGDVDENSGLPACEAEGKGGGEGRNEEGGRSGYTSLKEFVVDFAAATRQYAQRQLKWFRKDDQFLWVEIQPRLYGSKEAKVKCAQEVLQWCERPAAAFEQTVTWQIQCASRVQELRAGKKKVKLPKDFGASGVVDRPVLEYLVETGEVGRDVLSAAVLATEAGGVEDEYASGVRKRKCDDHVSPRDDWTARLAGIRVPESVASPTLRTYRSVLELEESHGGGPLVAFWADMRTRAAACTAELLGGNTDAADKFFAFGSPKDG